MKLIIEVDGFSHHFEENYKNDLIREKELTALGYIVLRFSDEEVMKDIRNVQRVIENYIAKS